MTSFLLPKPLWFLSLVFSSCAASCLLKLCFASLITIRPPLLRQCAKATKRTSQSSTDIQFICLLLSYFFIIIHHALKDLLTVVTPRQQQPALPCRWRPARRYWKQKNQFHLNLHDLRNPFKHTEPFSERKYCWICRIWIICFKMRLFQIVVLKETVDATSYVTYLYFL